MWQVGSERISPPCPWGAVCLSTRVLSPKYALKYVFFPAWAPFHSVVLIRSVSLANQIGENHDVENSAMEDRSAVRLRA